jgi:hypothetical protein
MSAPKGKTLMTCPECNGAFYVTPYRRGSMLSKDFKCPHCERLLERPRPPTRYVVPNVAHIICTCGVKISAPIVQGLPPELTCLNCGRVHQRPTAPDKEETP